MLYTQVCFCARFYFEGTTHLLSSPNLRFRRHFAQMPQLIAGDMSLSPFERGLAQSRHAQPRTLPAIHEAIAVRPLPVAADARTNLPWCQTRAV